MSNSDIPASLASLFGASDPIHDDNEFIYSASRARLGEARELWTSSIKDTNNPDADAQIALHLIEVQERLVETSWNGRNDSNYKFSRLVSDDYGRVMAALTDANANLIDVAVARAMACGVDIGEISNRWREHRDRLKDSARERLNRQEYDPSRHGPIIPGNGF